MNIPTVNNSYRVETRQLNVPPRLLLGPGPSNAHPRVLQALGTSQIGHLDQSFLTLMDEVQNLLRYVWQTDNKLTIPVSGTGSAAMEASVANTIEPGDVFLVGVNGYFGDRLADMASRYRADVREMKKEWGEVYSLEELRVELERHRPAILALIHAETSTGVLQPLEGVGELCAEFDCLLLVDTVTSLGGVPLFLDEWGVDIAYSGSQKCLSCPPGISPLTLSSRATDKVERRKDKVPNWYLDTTLLSQYWGGERAYHHTAPISMIYAFREALRIVAEEGLATRWARHKTNAERLWQGLTDLGLECFVPANSRLPSLTTVRVPNNLSGEGVRAQLLQEFNIEIASGLGKYAKSLWRIGLMGFNSRQENVSLVLRVLDQVLSSKQESRQ